MTGVDSGLRRSLCGPVTVQEARLQTSDYSKEMDDLVTGQRPSAHLFPGEESEPAARPRPCFWMHAAPRRQSTGALAAWPDPAGYWPTDGEEGAGEGGGQGGWEGWSRFYL